MKKKELERMKMKQEEKNYSVGSAEDFLNALYMNELEYVKTSMKARKKQLMKDLAIELGNRRKDGGDLTVPAFEISEVAYKCGVTEQTVRNFEDGTSVNPIVLLYYCSWIYEPYIAYDAINWSCENNRIDALIDEITD